MSLEAIEASAERVLVDRFTRPDPASEAFYGEYDHTAATLVADLRDLDRPSPTARPARRTPTRSWLPAAGTSPGTASTPASPNAAPRRRRSVTAGPQYHRSRARAIAYGQWQPWAEPAPVRQHIARLRGQGGSYHGIARAAGVAARTVRALIDRRRPHQAGHRRRAAGRHHRRRAPRPAARRRHPAAAAVADGHGPRLHPDGPGSRRPPGHHPPARLRRRRTVSPRLHEARPPAVGSRWDKTPPACTHRQRAVAHAARTRARQANWCTPLALDEDLIDCIGYQPEHGWRPATGTGPAPEHIRPASRTTAPELASPADPASDYELGAAAAHLTITGLAARGYSAARSPTGMPRRSRCSPATASPANGSAATTTRPPGH